MIRDRIKSVCGALIVLTPLVASLASAQSYQAKLSVPDGMLNGEFGCAVATDGNRCLIGVRRDGGEVGAVCLYEDGSDRWYLTDLLTPSGGQPGDWFGDSVAMDGDTIVVGASARGPGGAGRSGVVHVFALDPHGNWELAAILSSPDGGTDDRFGYAVAIDGDTIVVGAHLEDAQGTDSGAAYVFVDGPDGWELQAALTPDDGGAGDEFGIQVGIHADDVVIGAVFADAPDLDSGAAYVFHREDGAWAQIAKLAASDHAAHSAFGNTVGISGDSLVVGAYTHNTGIGAVYVFEKPLHGWSDTTETARLAASDGALYDEFGGSAAIDADIVVVGAHQQDGCASDGGAGYMFRAPSSGWTDTSETTQHHALDCGNGDRFGYRVALSGNLLLVGAPYHDASTGAAYLISLVCPGDHNGDGEVNTLDVLLFLVDWAAGGDLADCNGDGVVNTLDFICFLNAWTAGCP